MPNVTINLSKWYHYIMALAPLVAMLATAWFWLDTRYMHKEISDTRFIQLQLDIVSGQLMDYHRMIDNGETLTAKEQQDYEMYKFRLQMQETERSKKLGIGDLPQ